jgi:hypothetical protein
MLHLRAFSNRPWACAVTVLSGNIRSVLSSREQIDMRNGVGWIA